MAFLVFILLGAALMALIDGAILQAIGIAAFAVLLAVVAGGRRGSGRWFVGFGWGRIGHR